VGADSVPVKQDFRGGLDPSAALSAGCDQPAGPWPSLFLVLKAHRSVYKQAKALYSETARTERSVYIAPLGGSTWQSPPHVANRVAQP